MFCYHCGQRLPDEALFCMRCGTKQPRIGENRETGMNAAKTPAPPAKNRMTRPGEEYRLDTRRYSQRPEADTLLGAFRGRADETAEEIIRLCRTQGGPGGSAFGGAEYFSTLLSVFFAEDCEIYRNVPYRVLFPEMAGEYRTPGSDVHYVLFKNGKPALGIVYYDGSSKYLHARNRYTRNTFERCRVPLLNFFSALPNRVPYCVDRIRAAADAVGKTL